MVSLGVAAVAAVGARALPREEPDEVRRAREWAAMPTCADAPTLWDRQNSPRLSTGPRGGLEGGGGRLTDIDGDGYTDVLFQHSLGEEFRVFWGNAEGVLPEAAQVVPGLRMTANVNGSDAGDLNHDGWPDLVGVSTEDNGFVVAPGTGNRSFGAGQRLSSGQVPVSVRLVDWNGDGLADLTYAKAPPDGRLEWRAGTGDGFRFEGGRLLTEHVDAFDIADVDGDALPDLVVADTTSVRAHKRSDDFRALPSYAEAPIPLARVSVVRVVPAEGRPIVLVGGRATPTAGGAVMWSPGTPPCKILLPEESPHDFGLFNQDTRVDFTNAASCAYCTTNYEVLVGVQ